MLKKLMSCVLSVMLVLGLTTTVRAASSEAKGTYKIVVDGYDWGPSVSKAIISLDQDIDAITKDDIGVKETKMWYGGSEQTFDRVVTNAYLSDDKGNVVTTKSKHITLELKVSPDDGSPFIYSGVNDWTDPYYLTFDLKTKLNEDVITTLNIEQEESGKIMPQADQFAYDKHSATDGRTYSYAHFTPGEDNGKNPLIVWLHGGGEGGNDATVAVLGNRVSGLIEDDIQGKMGGAYVLAPQSPTAWMEGYSTTNGGKSIYTAGLMDVIKTYVNSHPDIDTNRIYIGGCSNGGYMTINMIEQYPGYFTAGFPICSGYADNTMSEEAIKALAKTPLWFLYSNDDDVLAPDVFSIPMIDRLNTANPKDLKVSTFENVVDTSGLYKDKNGDPHKYSGHWSWIYAFNSESIADDENIELFDWLSKQNKGITATGSQKIVVEGFDWGPSVTKTIIQLDHSISSITKEQLNVIESKYAMNWAEKTAGIMEFDRTITNAYLSDTNGNPVNGESAVITIEMAVSPNDGSPFFYDINSGLNSWTDPYDLVVTLKSGEEITSGENKITQFDITKTPTAVDATDADLFKQSTYTKGDQTLSYATFDPAKDDVKNPLMIWLHGAGEGGTDTSIITLGNRVTSLVQDEIQGIMKGAYVLAPQAPTMWMDDGTGTYTKDGTSKYTEVLMDLIKYYVDNNPDIDTNRIYIGGCSNGGYMTMNMIMEYPSYFTAAFPICEAYDDSWITDDMINSIKDLPIWFTHAANDTTVDPEKTILKTFKRLEDAGNKNVILSYFDDVHDTSGLYKGPDGQPHQYNGHWSWIYTLNNECVENNVTIFEWLAKQVKEEVKPNPDKEVPNTADKTSVVALGGLVALSLAAGYLAIKKRK